MQYYSIYLQKWVGRRHSVAWYPVTRKFRVQAIDVDHAIAKAKAIAGPRYSEVSMYWLDWPQPKLA